MTPRENPFAAARFAPGKLPFIGEIDSLVARACVPNARLQILGPHGSGKTTLLFHLAERAAKRGWATHSLRGSRGFDPLSLLSARGPLVVFGDEIEELGPGSFALLRACCAVRRAALVVTAHSDLGWETLSRRSVDAGLVHELCRHLTNGAFSEPPEAIDALLARHRGNVREVFFDLYDACAR